MEPYYLVSFLLLVLCHLFWASSAQFQHAYDFVIVGGGTAGCTLATRLSQSGKHTVLVLEAGGVPHPDFELPGTSPRQSRSSEYFRRYVTVPQQNAGLVTNGTRIAVVARTLGGGSSVNGMVWNRGSPFDMDNWAQLVGDPSWTYQAMLDYFKKSENYSGEFPSHQQHGFSGPITVSQPKYAPGLKEWLSAGQFLGFPIADPNGPQRISYTPMEFSKRAGRRVSAYAGYLKPAMGRDNLRVVTKAEVTKVQFTGNVATGVKYKKVINEENNNIGSSHHEDEYYFVTARKEVIISAGAIESPTLLMRSGIGPKGVLQASKIPIIRENANVGRHLQDHVMLPLVFILNDTRRVFDPIRDLTPEAMDILNRFGDGPYSSASGAFAQALLSSSGNSDPRWPNTILVFTNSPGTVPPVLREHFNDSLSNLAPGEVPTACWVVVGRPQSMGVVKLDINNPDNLPVVDFQYLTHPSDNQIMMEGIAAAVKTFESTPSFGRLGARLHSASFPACRHIRFRSEDYWRCYIRQLATFGGHPSGTNRMGRGRWDPGAVVDSQLQVIGVDRLRVVDASIMPAVTNANLQAVVYAIIAEKAADLILQKWETIKSFQF